MVVPAFVGLGAPHWDPDARGAIMGLTLGSSVADIALATVDAMAYQVADVLAAMALDAAGELGALRVDGGAAVNDALLQFQADILRVPVERPRVTETTALGAALPGRARDRPLVLHAGGRGHVAAGPTLRAGHAAGRARPAGGPLAARCRTGPGLGVELARGRCHGVELRRPMDDLTIEQGRLGAGSSDGIGVGR